ARGRALRRRRDRRAVDLGRLAPARRMSFALPAALWALPAAALPLAIHLLSRRAARRQTFSDLTLLASLDARSRPRSRLRELLLLAARTLLILALVLAAAGPVARGSSSSAGAEGLDLV